MKSSLEYREQLRKELTSQLNQKAKSKSKQKENPKINLKEKPKAKNQSKEYSADEGLQFPVYLFDWKGKLIEKIKSREMLTDIGISGGSAVLYLRDKLLFRNSVYLSYNKNIDLAEFKK